MEARVILMNKFQMIALEMEKIGFRSLPKDVTVNGEFESMIRNDFSMVDGVSDFSIINPSEDSCL